MSLESFHYEKLINSLPAAAVVVRLDDNKIEFINDHALAALTLERSRAIGRSADTLWVYPDHRAEFIAQLKSDDAVQDLPTTLEAGDGAQVNVLLSSSNINLDSGPALLSIFYPIGSTTNYEERLKRINNDLKNQTIQNEKNLLLTKEKLSGILEHSLQGIIVHRENRPLFANKSLSNIIGYSIDEIMGMDDILLMVAREEWDFLRNQAPAILRDPNRSHHFRIKAIKKDGTEIWISNRSEIVDWDGHSAVLATLTDITSEVLATQELERANQELENRIEERTRELQESQDRLTNAVHIAHIGYGTWSFKEKCYTHCSAAHAAIFDLEPNDFLGHPSLTMAMAHPDDRDNVRQAMATIDKGGQVDIEFRIITATGKIRWIRQICTGVTDERGAFVEEHFVSQDTTDRKLHEERLLDTNKSLAREVDATTKELAASEIKFRALAEHSLVGLAVIYNDRFLFVNPAWASMYGYSVKEMMDLESAIELIAPGYRAIVSDIGVALTNGENVDGHLEVNAIRKDGSEIWLNSSRAPIKWDGKSALLVSNINITKRKAAEKALQESQDLITSLLENAPYAFSVKNKAGKFLLFNAARLEALHKEQNEYFEQPIRNLFSAEDVDVIEAADRRVFETGQAVGLDEEFQVKHADTDIRLIKFPLLNSGGEVENIGTIAIDVTRELADRRKLQESERATRAVFESSLIGAAIYSRKSDRITFANTRLLELLDVTWEQLEERSPGWIWADPTVMKNITNQLNVSGSSQEFVELRKADGTPLWCMFACRISPISPDETMFWVHDLTDLHETQIALIQAKDQAETADLAKSDFLSAMSHELRTPLNAVLGFAQLLESDTDNNFNEDQALAVKMILSSGELLLSLINEVLDLTRIQDGNIKLDDVSVNLEVMLTECVELVSPLREERGLSMHFDPESFGELEVRGDPMRLKQVVLNLLQNAVKYNQDAGSISVRLGSAEQNRVRVIISDTGKGIAELDKESIFSPFERLGEANGAIEGTGIGLTIAKRLIEAMGGAIGVESEHGKGCEFWIELPAAGDRQNGTSSQARVSEFV
jgi:PAS domain S-box-containing protein